MLRSLLELQGCGREGRVLSKNNYSTTASLTPAKLSINLPRQAVLSRETALSGRFFSAVFYCE